MATPVPTLGPAAALAGALPLLLVTMWIALYGSTASEAPPPPGGAAALLVSLSVLLQAAPAVAAMALSAAGLGWPIRSALVPNETRAAGVVLQLAAGLAALLLIGWLLGLAGWLNGWSAWGLCAAGAAMLAAQVVRAARRRGWTLRSPVAPAARVPWPVLLCVPPIGLLLVAVTCPPGTLWTVEALGYDVLSYHLQLPREWLELGGIRGLEHNVYSYLPSLVEAGYMQLGAMHGSVYEAVYAAQLFHATTAVLAAAAVGVLTARFAGTMAGALAAALLLATPWTLITGSLAYNEMAVLAFAAAAMLALFPPPPARERNGEGVGRAEGEALHAAPSAQAGDERPLHRDTPIRPSPERGRGKSGLVGAAALAGFLAGAATLAKLPAGAMVAVPVGLAALVVAVAVIARRRESGRPLHLGSIAAVLAGPAVAAVVGGLVLAPYLLRNAVWTGNPVFPFAAATFGSAHWSDQEVDRWVRGHAPEGDLPHRLAMLRRHWLQNRGYGAVGGSAGKKTLHTVARFRYENGFPLLWSLALTGACIGLSQRQARPLALVMLGTLGVQLVFWLAVTHLQSRFLVPALLPGCVLAGMAAHERVLARARPWVAAVLVPLPVVALVALSCGELWHQVVLQLRPWQVVGALPSREELRRMQPGQGLTHPVSFLPPRSRTLMVADAGRLLYIDRPFEYHSAFDPNPLGRIIRETGGDPAAVTEALRARGVTHVWVNWSELERLHATYGFDRDVTAERVERIAVEGGWRAVFEQRPVATLFVLPG